MAEDKDFLATARRRFAAAAEDEKHLRDKFEDDLRFASPDGDEQWDPKIAMDRKQAGRPTLSFPRCHTFVQQVSNEARQNKPQIKFAPRLDADKDTAEVYEGLARYIQYTSDAQIAYETAIEYSAGASFGYYRFLTDYAAVAEDMPEDTPEDQLPKDLKVVPVLDPLTVYGILVPACFNRKPMFAFVVEDIPKDEYKNLYGESEMASLSWAEAEKQGEGWVGSDSVRIAEYWYVKEGKAEKGKRKPKSTVHFCKTNGMEVLDESATVWPGSTIPIIPVLGKQMIAKGKAKLFSVVRPQKAAQQLINYSKSRIAETLSTSPISPYMVVNGQIPSGQEGKWATLNTNPAPYLLYDPVDVEGRPAPPPQRQTFEPPIQALSSFVMQEIDDMKATTGIFDASLGNSANEVSGQAILRRKQQTDLTTMHFMDNLVRSFKKGGEVIAELIPKIYDTAREIEILGEDESSKVVKINQAHEDESGKPQHFDMTKGKYVPIVTAGKAFDSKREESFDTMQQLIQSAPDMLPMFGDVLFESSDMAGSSIVAERFKKMLPPNLQDQDGQEKVPPQAQAQIQQLGQHAQALNEACKHYEGVIQQLTAEKQGKVVEHQGKMEEIAAKAQADMALEDKKLLTQITIAEISTKAQIVSDRETDRRALEAQFHDQAHDLGMQAQKHQQTQEISAQQDQQQSDMAEQQAGHQQEAQAQQADATSQQSAQDAAQQQAAQPAESGNS